MTYFIIAIIFYPTVCYKIAVEFASHYDVLDEKPPNLMDWFVALIFGIPISFIWPIAVIAFLCSCISKIIMKVRKQ